AQLAVVHQVVGAPQQRLRVGPVLGVRGDSHAHRQPHAVDLDARYQGGEALGSVTGLGRVDVGKQQHELVAAPAEGAIGGALVGPQHVGDGDEGVVTDGVAEAVVDLLEVVEVEHDDVEWVVVAQGAGQL